MQHTTHAHNTIVAVSIELTYHEAGMLGYTLHIVNASVYKVWIFIYNNIIGSCVFLADLEKAHQPTYVADLRIEYVVTNFTIEYEVAYLATNSYNVNNRFINDAFILL